LNASRIEILLKANRIMKTVRWRREKSIEEWCRMERGF
jgi:hypothetical protein